MNGPLNPRKHVSAVFTLHLCRIYYNHKASEKAAIVQYSVCKDEHHSPNETVQMLLSVLSECISASNRRKKKCQM